MISLWEMIAYLPMTTPLSLTLLQGTGALKMIAILQTLDLSILETPIWVGATGRFSSFPLIEFKLKNNKASVFEWTLPDRKQRLQEIWKKICQKP